MSNTSSNANSGYKLEHDLACLAEMFPSVDCKVLRNYLEIFSDQANHLSVIIDMLLQGERSNLDQNATQEQSAIKQKIAREDCNSCSVEAGIEELSPNKLQRRDSSCSDTDSLPPMLGEGELDGKAKVLGSNESELLTSCSENSDKKEVNTVKSLKCNSDNDDCDIVLVKIVESSARKSFHRTSNCISKSGTTSPSRHNGICIRYKGGVFHPSMTKPRKQQIVEIDADGKSCTGNNNTQSLSNRDQSKSGQSPGRKRQSIAKPSYSKTSTVVHCAEPSDSGKEVLMVEEIRSRKEGLSATASVSDLEILKKVFPDADPIQIGLLLEKYANEPNKVALVGKELGNKPDTQAHSLRRKVLLPRVTWFWESGDNKLVPFTDSECNVLEKEFQNCKSDYSGVASDKLAAIMLPGSTKSVKVNFFKMTMACSNNGTKSHIFRVPEGNEENKEISGKCLIPQEALTVPNDWQQQSKGAELVRVRPGSAEWDHVLGSLKRSIKKAVVVNVQRVQNKWLYRKYAIQRHLLKEKNGVASINEKELFHGTRQTSP
ncbi:uncharacterized protein LOC111329465 [Stylophora pistillata]|uniref:Poly [ADP-ribose] polymerase 11 n=1 Tax=Stylophora pistillata TaxID=50429 RepID=A0A2B4S5Y8_STYPI|nr:uncharacterized protein LOC111329465 [Stylophora pistillata]PFX26104.1 Poly [ADP-ribose] polymerase 11 [Stylophora pistillata]